MKIRNIVFVLIFCLFCHEGQCQWQIIYEDSNFYNMGVQFLNPDTGFVVGVNWSAPTTQQGIIFRTTNGGMTWDSVYTSAGNFMIEFPNTSIGYTGGHDGSVMKTTDMGASWNLAPSWCCNDYSNGYFFNSDTGFVILWTGEIIKTTNGSNNWQPGQTIGGYSPFPGIGSIQFINDSTGIVAAGYNGIYARTSDAGNTWLISTIDSSMFLSTIYMKDPNNGYAVGYFGKYSETSDGGNSWTSPISLCSFHLHDIAFFTDSVGYIVGGRDPDSNNPGIINGVILKTIDAGNSWYVIDSSFTGYLTSITIINDSVGYVCGGGGLILKILNGNSVTSIAHEAEFFQFNIFPNPASDEISIICSKSGTLNNFKIINVLGETKLYHYGNLPDRINISNYSPGIYSIQIGDDHGIHYSKKFIKQ